MTENVTEIKTVNIDLDAIKNAVLEYLENKDVKSLKAYLHDIDNIEIMYIMSNLSRKEKGIVFRLLNKDSALYIFEQLGTDLQKELLESFANEYTIELIEELDPDDRVELLDEMPAAVAKRLINALSPEEREITNTLMGYKPETAGRLMTPKFITLRRNMTAGEALSKVRRQAKEDKETVYTLYVTDDTKKIEGVVTLKYLLAADDADTIENIMADSIISVSTDTKQEKTANMLKEFDLLAIPVVDKENRIVGIVTVDDAIDVLEDEATKDMYSQAGLANIKSKEKSNSEVLVRGSLFAVWKVRLPFLLLALVGGIAAAILMGGFEDILYEIVLVAFFVPLIMDMGGSVGTQSTTVFARGLALGDIDTKRFGKHLAREAGIGLSIGVIAGILGGLVAGIWGHFGSYDPGMWRLGFAVGLALMITTTIAATVGFLVPFLLTKMKLDQVAGAAPIITTIKDLTGLLTYFLFVMLFLNAFL